MGCGCGGSDERAGAARIGDAKHIEESRPDHAGTRAPAAYSHGRSVVVRGVGVTAGWRDSAPVDVLGAQLTAQSVGRMLAMGMEAASSAPHSVGGLFGTRKTADFGGWHTPTAHLGGATPRLHPPLRPTAPPSLSLRPGVSALHYVCRGRCMAFFTVDPEYRWYARDMPKRAFDAGVTSISEAQKERARVECPRQRAHRSGADCDSGACGCPLAHVVPQAIWFDITGWADARFPDDGPVPDQPKPLPGTPAGDYEPDAVGLLKFIAWATCYGTCVAKA